MKVAPQYLVEMGRLKWKSTKELDSEFGIKLGEESDVERHRIIVDSSIMYTLIKNPDGIGKIRLAKIVGVDRKNIGSYLNRLVKSGYVKRGSGLRGKYFPTDKISQNHLLSSYFMGNIFVSQILGKSNVILRAKSGDANDIDFRDLLPYLQREEFSLMRTMFEFVNCIGAYMIYVLIQAMNPDNIYLKNLKYLNKDTFVEYWVKNSIDIVIRNLLPKFKDAIRLDLNSLVGNDKDPFGPFIEYGMSVPSYQLGKKTIDELLQAYIRLYPHLLSELETQQKQIPVYMHLHKEHKEYLQMQKKYQKDCEHKYVDKVSRLDIEDGKKFWTTYVTSPKLSKQGNSIVHCIKCHHTTYQKFVTNSLHESYQKFLK